jgi:phage shock protein PspC (stress-responsive transcriptional regulator)
MERELFMNELQCKEAVASLLAFLENGTPMPESHRQHLNDCPHCKPMMDGVRALAAPESDDVATTGDARREQTFDAATRELRAARRRRTITAALLATLAAILIIPALVIFPDHSPSMYLQSLALVALTLFLFGAAIVLPLAILQRLVHGSPRSATQRPLYKRLGPGRQLAGVALGIAEHTGLSVTAVRLIFIALVVTKGAGLLLYIVLALSMPVHPADREHMLRFRLRRALARTHANRAH